MSYRLGYGRRTATSRRPIAKGVHISSENREINGESVASQITVPEIIGQDEEDVRTFSLTRFGFLGSAMREK